MQRQLDNKDRHIQNLKSGKMSGKGKGGGNAAFQGWAANGQQGKGSGNQGRMLTPCPPDVCRDYNFKAEGCTRPSCSFKHVCCSCGQAHPHRGNH